jgi:hypothetical protein
MSPAYANANSGGLGEWEAVTNDGESSAELAITDTAASSPAAVTDSKKKKKPDATSPAALTPQGNANLVDDVSAGAEDKQFITVTTKTGEYFYIIIDRTGSAENVYFLNLVDNSDLTALLGEETVTAAVSKSAVSAPAVSAPTVSIEEKPAENSDKEKPGVPTAALGILIILAAGAAAFYFLKIRKGKSRVRADEDFSDLAEFDFDDDEEDYGSSFGGELPPFDDDDVSEFEPEEIPVSDESAQPEDTFSSNDTQDVTSENEGSRADEIEDISEGADTSAEDEDTSEDIKENNHGGI